MSLAQRFERRLEGLVGGAFARVFKGQVEPVEIGTALQREAVRQAQRHGQRPGALAQPLPRHALAVRPRAARAVGEPAHELPRRTRPGVPGREPAGRRSATSRSTSPATTQLHTGVFGVASRMESGAPPRRRPHDSLSLPIVPGVPLGRVPAAARSRYRRVGARRCAGPAPVAAPPAPLAPGARLRAPAVATPPAAASSRRRTSSRGLRSRRRYQPPQQPPDRRSSRTRPAAAMLIVDQSNRRFDLRTGSNVIGRGTDSDLQLLDQGISRRHLDIQYDGNFATAYDLGSTNGTTVNGHEISSQLLRHGDVDPGGPHPHRVPPGARVTVPAAVRHGRHRAVGAVEPERDVNSALALQLMRFGFLALLWLFVLAAMRVIRSDLRTSGQPRIARAAAGPPPRHSGAGNAAAAAGPGRADAPARHRGRAHRHPHRAHRRAGADRPGQRLDPRARGRLRQHPARAHQPAGRHVGRRGPRLDQRHLPRPAQARRPGARWRSASRCASARPCWSCARWRSILRYAVRSDLGLVRTNNEDSVYAGPAAAGHRRRHGRARRRRGRQQDRHRHARAARRGPPHRRPDARAARRGRRRQPPHRRRRAASAANSRAWAPRSPRCASSASQVGLVHVGDSRAYLLRNDQLSQITHDDTYVQYLVDSGKLTPDEAKDHPRKSVILRALLGTDVEPDVSIREARARRPLPAVLGRAVRRRVDRDDPRHDAHRGPAGVRRPARRARAARRRPGQRHRHRRRRHQRQGRRHASTTSRSSPARSSTRPRPTCPAPTARPSAPRRWPGPSRPTPERRPPHAAPRPWRPWLLRRRRPRAARRRARRHLRVDADASTSSAAPAPTSRSSAASTPSSGR